MRVFPALAWLEAEGMLNKGEGSITKWLLTSLQKPSRGDTTPR